MKSKTRPGALQRAAQACVRWLGIPIDAGNGATYNLGDGRLASRAAGQCVSVNGAMQLSAVWACVTLLSDTISTLPLNFYERTPNGRKPAVDHPLYRVLHRQPNTEQTATQFLGAFVASMLLRDGGYAEKQLSAGRLIGLEYLRRDWLVVTRKLDGELEYAYTEYGKRRIIPEELIWKVPGFSLDGYNGCSSIQFGAKVFAGAMAADTAAEGAFERGLMATTFFKYPTVLKQEQRDEARKTIKTLSGALNSGEPVIMEAGMEAGQLGINPVDAQLLESRAFSVEEICSWFRVQPFMIGRASQGQTNWGTGIEQQMIGFVTFTLGPWLKRIEQAIVKDLLRPEEKDRFYAEFSLEGLLRGDSAARKEWYSSATQNGWMSRNEVRALENREPIEGGDVFTVQSALTTLDMVGKQPPTSVAPPATPAKQSETLLLNLSLAERKPAGMKISRDEFGNVIAVPVEPK